MINIILGLLDDYITVRPGVTTLRAPLTSSVLRVRDTRVASRPTTGSAWDRGVRVGAYDFFIVRPAVQRVRNVATAPRPN